MLACARLIKVCWFSAAGQSGWRNIGLRCWFIGLEWWADVTPTWPLSCIRSTRYGGTLNTCKETALVANSQFDVFQTIECTKTLPDGEQLRTGSTPLGVLHRSADSRTS